MQIRLPKLHPAQTQIVAEARRFNVLCCGRRFGKTVLALDRLLRHGLAGKPTAWFAPNYRLLAATWRDCLAILGGIVESNRNDKIIQFPGGGSLEFWSLDTPSPARSRKYAAIVIDESGHAPDLRAQWENAIRPTLTDLRGEAWFPSTPNGIANFFHTLYQRGQDAEREDWKSWQMPTSENPYIAGDEIEAAPHDMSELAFRQEYLAEFVCWEGAIFRQIQRAVWTPPEEFRRHQEIQPWPTWAPTFAIGVDWARTNDYTVFSVATDVPFVQADPDAGRIDSTSIVEIDRFRGLEYRLQQSRLHALYERYGRPVVLAESNAMGQPVIEQLARDGMRVRGFHTTNATKARIVDDLALDFERGRIRIPDDPVLVGELQAFEATRLDSGLTRYAAPEGGHDDCVISVALARHALAKYAGAYSMDPYRVAMRRETSLRLSLGGASGSI
jgi:phage FluMu gp28-like protein